VSTSITRSYEKLFPVPVLFTKVPNGRALNERLAREIGEIRAVTPNGKPDSWACDVYTTMTNNNALHQRPAFKEFTEITLQCLTTFGEMMGYSIKGNEIKITQCWLNIYDSGMSQEIHHHPNSIMTGVYYVAAPKNCSKIMFHSPYADTMIRPPILEDDPLNSMTSAYEPDPGDLIIFDSALRHSVPTNENLGERISISFNAQL
jgi:uncharacterized protein (TIGR02466 family)